MLCEETEPGLGDPYSAEATPRDVQGQSPGMSRSALEDSGLPDQCPHSFSSRCVVGIWRRLSLILAQRLPGRDPSGAKLRGTPRLGWKGVAASSQPDGPSCVRPALPPNSDSTAC